MPDRAPVRRVPTGKSGSAGTSIRELRTEVRDEAAHLHGVDSGRIAPLVEPGSPVLTGRVRVARRNLNVEMRHDVTEHERVNVHCADFDPQGARNAPRQRNPRQAAGPSANASRVKRRLAAVVHPCKMASYPAGRAKVHCWPPQSVAT